MGSVLRRASCAAFVVLFLAVSSFAFVQNAVLYGTVYDTSGKPVGGITVLLENESIGLARVTISSPDGSYTITEIPPAQGYRITALRSGAKIDVREGVNVNVGDERVVLPPLREQPAAATTKAPVVKVIEKGVSLDTVSPSISSVITDEQLRSLPLYNRNFLALGLLAANTHDVEAGSALAGATFSIAGARVVSNAFLLDGTDNVASSSNQAIPFQVNDAIQEFRVITSLAGAEYGRNLGGVVNVVTRRGSNAWHGGAFGYFANDALNANQPLSVYNGSGFDQADRYSGKLTNLATVFGPTNYNDYVSGGQFLGYCTDSLSPTNGPGLHRCSATGGFGKNTLFDPKSILAANDRHVQPFQSEQFGVNMGGALKKDKVFVFGSYEGTRIDNPNQIFERVPSTFDKTYNPLLAMGFPGATKFAFTATNPDYVLAKNVLSLFPASNVVGVPGVLEFYKGQAPNYTNVHNMIARTDVVQNSKSNWTFRYSAQTLDQLHDDSLPKQSQYAGNGALRNALNQNFSAVFTRTISNHVTNEARFGFTRFRVDETAQDAGLDATTFGLPGKGLMTFSLSGLDTQYSGASNINYGAYGSWTDSLWTPYFFGFAQPSQYPTLDGLFPMARIGAPLNAPGQRRDQTYSGGDNLAWSLGRHALRIGGEYRHLGNRFFNGAFSRGFVVSGDIGEFTSDSSTCTFCGDGFFAPSFDYALRQSAPYDGNFSSFAMAGYAQDTWRVSPQVTVVAGLRYEYFSPATEAHHQVWNFDPVANGLVQEGSTNVVDTNGTACGARRQANIIYPDQSFDIGWTCNKTGSPTSVRSDYNNFAPRIGVAIDARGNGKTVLRFGAGWYYDQLPVSDAAQLMYNRPTPLSLTNPQAIYGQNFLSNYSDSRICIDCGFGNTTLNPSRIAALKTGIYQAAASPFGVTARDAAHSATPYAGQFSGSLQQQISSKLALEIGYIGTRGTELPVVANTEFSNEWFCTRTTTCDLLGPVFTMANRGTSDYNSLMVRVRAAQWRGLRVNAMYNYSFSRDNASTSVFPVLPVTMTNQLYGFQYNGLANPYFVCASCAGSVNNSSTGGQHGGSITGSDSLTSGLTTTGAAAVQVSRYNLPQDPINFLKDDRGPSDFDNRHRAIVDFTWEVPTSDHTPRLLRYWTLSGIFSAHSGQPFTIFAGPIFGEITQRANVLGPVRMTGNPAGYIDPSNVRLASIACGGLFNGNFLPGPGSACTGDSGRNAYTGPAFATMDFAVQKAFRFGEARSLSFRGEFHNLFDRANYYNPISSLSTDGSLVNSDFGEIKSAHDPRQIQLAVRFTW